MMSSVVCELILLLLQKSFTLVQVLLSLSQYELKLSSLLSLLFICVVCVSILLFCLSVNVCECVRPWVFSNPSLLKGHLFFLKSFN